MRTAFHVLNFIHSTQDYGIHFTSSVTDPVHTFVIFLDLSDIEAYTDAKPPSPSHWSPLTFYSDACWGSQIGSAVCDGTLLLLFKCHSMSGGIVFCQGRPFAWTAVHQERTSLSFCKIEIHAINKVSKLSMGICHLAKDVPTNCHDIIDTAKASPLNNDN